MRERYHWMDLCRGVAILMVVVMHSFTMPAGRGVETFDGLIWFFHFLTPMRVPVLFALSGMLLAWALQKPFFTYMAGKIRNLLWPLILWSVLTAYAYGRPRLLDDPWAWIGGVSHMWFLGVLLFCFVVGWTVKIVPAWVYVVLFPLILAVAEMPNDVVLRYLYYGTYFMMGAVLWRWRTKVRTMGVWLPALSITGGIAGCFAAGSSPIHALGLIGLVAPIPWLFAMLWIGPRLPRVAFLESIGRNSVIWYCAHFPVLMVAMRWSMGAGLEGVQVNAVVLAASVLVPLLLVWAGPWARPLFSLPVPSRRRRPSTSSGAPHEPDARMEHRIDGASHHR